MGRNFQIQPPKVLILDDDAANSKLISEALIEDGYEVEMTSNGQVGLDYIRSKNFDVVFTDVKMPGISGIEIIRRAAQSKKPTKFVIISGYLSKENVAEIIALGVKKIYSKPLNLTRFVQSINEFIGYTGQYHKQGPDNKKLSEDDEIEVE